MQVLREYLELADLNDLERAANILERDLSAALAHRQNNPVAKFPQEDLDFKLGEAIKRLEAARRGLGLANRLKKPEDQRTNKSRILSNLNTLRAIVSRVTKELAGENQERMGVNQPIHKDGSVVESLSALADAAVENARTKSPGKRVATKSGLSAPADMNDNPFEGKARKLAKKVIKKVTGK